MKTDVVLVHPEIHWNTGNIGRTCLAVGATLHLVKPLGFSLDEREVRRAGLDYWPYVDVRVWESWEELEQSSNLLTNAWFFSTKGKRIYWDAPLAEESTTTLVFGRETGGLPTSILETHADRLLTIPMQSAHIRSLNLSTSVGIALFETLRQRARSK